MVINTSVSAASLQSKPILPSKSIAHPTATGEASATTGQSLSVSSDYLAASSLEITSQDAAQQSMEFAQNSILNQPSLVLLAQGGHQPQTVIDLLAL